MAFIVLLEDGPIAQWVEPPAHNRKVPGSIPGGPTISKVRFINAPFLIYSEINVKGEDIEGSYFGLN